MTLLPIQKCPLCNSQNKILLCTPEKDNIKSQIQKCLACDFIYNGIKLENKNSELLYDKFVYDEKDYQRWKTLYINKIKNIEKITKKKGNILDLGCGPGQLLAAAKESGWNEFGIEPFVNTYKFAKSKGLNVKNCLLKDTKFPDKYFDIIIAIEVIEHFINPVEEFKEMKRVLKDDGVVIIQTGNVDSLFSKFRKDKWMYYYYDHLCYFSPKTLTKLLEKVDMHIDKIFPDEVSWSARMKWCNNLKEKLSWTLFYFIRLLTLKRPILGSMTAYIEKNS